MEMILNLLRKLAQAAKVIGAKLATIGLIGAGIGVGIVIIMVFVGLSLEFPESFYVYCGDSLEEYYGMTGKISKVEEKVKYFSEQLEECDRLLKEASEDNESNEVKKDIMEARKDTETNLNIEKKVLDTLKSRLRRRNFDVEISTESSLGKRRYDE